MPYGTKAAYKAATGWKAFTNIIEMTPTGIESIEPAETGSRKVLHNGQIYLLYDGRMYDVQGRPVR